MACTITLGTIEGHTLVGGIPTKIRVKGSAQGCTKVLVSAIPLGTLEAAVSSDGTWIAGDFDNPNAASGATVRCKDSIKIKVVCKDHPGCTLGGEGRIHCAGSCAITIVAVEGADNNGGVPSTIRVRGTAVGCAAVVVNLPPFAPQLANVRADGTWVSPDFANPNPANGKLLKCGNKVKVWAVCKDDRRCFKSETKFLQCPDPCRITIDSAEGSLDASGIATRIKVKGSASGCSAVVVTLSPLGQQTALVQADGSWTTPDFTNPNPATGAFLECGKWAKVTAYCKANPDCQKSTAVLLKCLPPADQCPTTGTLRVRDLNGNPVDAQDCLPPGAFTVEVVSPAGTYTWSVDNVLQPGETLQQFTFVVSPGETHDITATVVVAECPPVSITISILGCSDDTSSSCPDRAYLKVVDEITRTAVDANSPCLPSGPHLFIVEAPTGTGYSYYWYVDQVLQVGAPNGPVFGYNVPAGQTHKVSVNVIPPGCPPAMAEVQFLGCGDCPDVTDIRVTGGCVPGSVTFEAVGTNLDQVASFDWSFGLGGVLGSASSSNPSTSMDLPPQDAVIATVTINPTGNCSPKIYSEVVPLPSCGTPPPKNGGGDGDCPWWNPSCWNIDICGFLGAGLAILIGGFLLATAYCGFSGSEAVSAAVQVIAAGGAAVGFLLLPGLILSYRDLCGYCNLAKVLIAGVAIAVIAVLFIWLFGGVLPPCWLPGLIAAGGFVIAAGYAQSKCSSG